MKTCGCYFNTYKAKIPLAPREQGCFYSRTSADIYIHARTEPKGKDSYNYTKVIVVSIDDFEWAAELEAVPFTGQELWGMQKDYIDQLPAGGATEENFRDFFASRGFTSFAGRMDEETRHAAEDNPSAAIGKCLSKVDFSSLKKLNRSIKDLLENPEYSAFLSGYRNLIDDDTIDVCIVRRHTTDCDDLEVDVVGHYYDRETNGEYDEVITVYVPVKYLLDRDLLEQDIAAAKAKKEQDMAAAKAKKEQEAEEKERERYLKLKKEYLELEKKYGGNNNG